MSVIIVTYNSKPCIAQCLQSVYSQTGISFEILVIDNASSDGTPVLLAELAPGTRTYCNHENVGFGRACNQAFVASRGRFLFLLNPDARIQQTDGLSRLVGAMERNPRWGLAGTRLVKEDGRVESDGEWQYPDQDKTRCDFSRLPGRLAWVSGASMFIARSVFAEVGGFDPGFFLSSEETDLCLRVRQKGWEVGMVDDVSIEHIGFASEAGSDPYDTWLKRVPGVYRFWSKHYPAEDTLRLVRRDRFRATFRRELYGLASRFTGEGSSAWRKHRTYAGISQASKDFLAQAASNQQELR